MEYLAASNQPISLGGISSKGKPQFLPTPSPVASVQPAVEPEAVPQAKPEGPSSEDWRTPVRAHEVGTWAQIPDKNKKGDDIVRSVPVILGVKVHMKDGSSWYRHNRTMSWTRTRPGMGGEASQPKMHMPGYGTPAKSEIKDEPIQHKKLVRDCLAGQWPGRKLLNALNWGLNHAESWRAQ